MECLQPLIFDVLWSKMVFNLHNNFIYDFHFGISSLGNIIFSQEMTLLSYKRHKGRLIHIPCSLYQLSLVYVHISSRKKPRILGKSTVVPWLSQYLIVDTIITIISSSVTGKPSRTLLDIEIKGNDRWLSKLRPQRKGKMNWLLWL